MHPNRRRKKRPNYGIRTVEVVRGPSGFGFTISGQQPCILSCIVANSPADQAGLSAGDFLISVNGISVSKITHEAVVNLIGNSNGPIKMTIAENYYSDSSDEDVNLGRLVNPRKPKYPHKPRMHRGYKHDFYKKIPKMKDNNYRVNEKYEDVACGLEIKPSPTVEEAGPIEYKAIVGYLGTIEMPKQLLPNARLQTVCGCIKKLRQEKRTPTAVLMTVLPTCLTLKNATNHILAIYPTNRVVYISSSLDKDSRYFGLVTSAVCDRSLENVPGKYGVSFANVWEGEKKCSNIGKTEVEVSNSCHVFMTDSKVVDHNLHIQKAENFKIACTNDAATGTCLEFPPNSLYIVSLVENMYSLQSSIEPHRGIEDLVANSPQPSASSNSDSGIGFRDDCGNVSDRILVVEFPTNRQPPKIHVNNNSNRRPINILASNISLDSSDLPLNNVRAKLKLNNDEPDRANLNNIRACETLSIKNIIDSNVDYLTKQPNQTSNVDPNRLNCRALPGSCRQPKMECDVEFSERPVDVPDGYRARDSVSVCEEDFKSSIDNISMLSASSLDVNPRNNPFKVPMLYKKKRGKRAHNLVASCDSLMTTKFGNPTNEDDKLSPKVYGSTTKQNFSYEELSRFEPSDMCGGSLQDLSSWCGPGHGHMSVTQSEPDIRTGSDHKMCEDNGNIKISGDRAAAWATSFEKLLECPVGLQAFSQFLKKEFSAENIYFWTACERYRKLSSSAERSAEAQRIYQRHLRVGACEAVNVDSQARQCVEQTLRNASANLFVPVQKQIYNLMKFDSYSRFMKSDLYMQCLSGNFDPQQLDPNLLLYPATSSKLKKSLSNAEDRRRKSLLPWHKKNRSKSKDRGEAEYADKKQDVNDNISEPSLCNNGNYSSKSSLTSLDLANCATSDITKPSTTNPRPPLCRIRLLNGSTTVVQIKQTESIKQLINRLLDKRDIHYSCFEVYIDKQRKALNVNESSSVLAGCEVDIEQRISFRLDLPNKKVIAVKSKCSKYLIEVLRPILQKYSYLLEEVEISRDNEIVDINQPVTVFDTAKLNVQLVRRDSGAFERVASLDDVPKSLDEITNKVYEDILQEKSDASTVKSKSDKESVKSEDWGSEHSGIIGRFLKKDLERNRDRKKKSSTRTKGNSLFGSIEDVAGDQTQSGLASKKPLIAKLKPGVKLQNTSESEELYEGLSRAQRSRLEDQRGTEINFELPDFLKNKENEQSRKAMWVESGQETSKFYNNVTLMPKQEPSVTTLSMGAANPKLQHPNYENRIYLTETNHVGYYPFGATVAKLPAIGTPLKNSELCAEIQNNVRVEPPPLPPKPKVLPIKPSNWSQRNNPRKDSYLEQATSSFV